MPADLQSTESNSSVAPAVLVVMGVSGSGKSTVGALLALRLRWEFEDADWLPPCNIRGSAALSLINEEETQQ